MSIRINVNGMSYKGFDGAQRAEIDKRRKTRIAEVRQQSKEIAQRVRTKVQCEKEKQLKKVQAIKMKELEEWKKLKQNQIQKEYGRGVTALGEAHIAACETSCEEGEVLRQKREENVLIAAERGRFAMLQEQRKREREAEERLLKKKRKKQKSVSIQADIVCRKEVGTNVSYSDESCSEVEEECLPEERAEPFVSKPNLHKACSMSTYNPKNFTSNSVDSSNNCESEEEEEEQSYEESEVEFNQITNLLKRQNFDYIYKTDRDVVPEEFIEELSIDSETMLPPHFIKEKSITKPKTKSILKTIQIKKPVATTNLKERAQPTKAKNDNFVKKPAKEQTHPIDQAVDRSVKYVDFGNKYVSTYTPNDNLVTENKETSKPNAKVEAKKLGERGPKNNSSEVLKQLAEIRGKEALKKEKIRRDYERLQMELADVAKREQELRLAAGKTHKNYTSTLQQKQEEARKKRMNEMFEDAMKRNIITCPPVDSNVAKAVQKAAEVNVAAPEFFVASSTSSTEDKMTTSTKFRKTNEEVNNLVKIERLKDLLDRINHQKQLLLREIERSDDVPGRDFDKIVKCLENLEKEKAALDSQPVVTAAKKKEDEELQARERKIAEREKRLEDKIRELYKKKKEAEKNSVESVTSSEEAKPAIPPVEIIIKVQPTPPRHSKHRKSIRCIDTLNRAPGKVYPKTPKKKKQTQTEQEVDERKRPEQTQQQTQTSPPLSEASLPKPILKKPQEVPSSLKPNRRSDESSQSVSTTYQSLPEKINIAPTIPPEFVRKPHHKLNPVLMHYITRLLGMSKNIGRQLSVNVSPVETPGSSTINTTGNVSDVKDPSFDQQRFEKLQQFINDNYSFLSEVNETLERSQLQEQNEENISKVEDIWRDALRKKKPVTVKDGQKQQAEKPLKDNVKTAVKPSQVQQKAPAKKLPALKEAPPKQPQASLTVRNQAPVPTRSQASEPVKKLQRPQTASVAGRRPVTASTQPSITHRDMINVTKYLESHMLSNYTEYTANCQKRIAELAQMMDRVRQEKLKLIENSLSSGEFGHFTEYKEIVIQGKTLDVPTTSASDLKDSPTQREDPPSEEINNILQRQTRPFGVSKDSGISMSRPVTSSDFRDSPDVRVTSEERENTFQPIFKDIPKTPRMKVTPPSASTTDVSDDLSQLKEQEDKTMKKQKPPLSLIRLSPHTEKPHEPHELSTIAEVETPSASKINLHDNIEELGMKSFPNFEEYAKNLQARAEADSIQQQSSGFLQLDDLKTALDQLQVHSFVQPQEYGIEELSKDVVVSRSSSNASSIIDIVEELKRRNIIDKAFQDDDHTTPTTTNIISAPRSPKRKPPQSRIIIKTPENADVEIQRKTAQTPTKKRPLGEAHPEPDGHQSNDTLSGIQEIEKEPKDDLVQDFQDMGINWAATELKRNRDSKELECGTSGSSVENGKSIVIEMTTTKTSTYDHSSSSSSSTGKPLNLKEFLARELTRRSRVDRSSSDESSLSSQFMRSLLNATSSRSSSEHRSEGTSERDKLRTSTPVHTKGSSLQGGQRTGNSQMFPGESLSTLKASEGEASGKSDSSGDKENQDRRDSNQNA